MGRPRGSKNKKNSDKKQVQAMLDANNIIKHGIQGAYAIKNKNSSPASTVSNCHRIISKEVKQNIRTFLEADAIAETNKSNLEKLYQWLIAKFIEGDTRVKASDVRGCLDSLSKLVAEFKERHEIDDVSSLQDEKLNAELDKEVKSFMSGYKTQEQLDNEPKPDRLN